LFAQPFDPNRLNTTGEPVMVADHIGIASGFRNYAFSASGDTLAYWSGTFYATTQLTWFDRRGRKLGTVGELGRFLGFSLSPDERRVAVERLDDRRGAFEAWLLDLTGGAAPTRVTVTGDEITPLFSPDGTKLVTATIDQGITIKPLGGGSPTIVYERSTWTDDWSPDGQLIMFHDNVSGGARLATTAANGHGPAVSYLQRPYSIGYGQFSPDGHWTAYESFETGSFEVYVDSFPTAGNRIRVSIGGGRWPRWRRDGKELFYLAPDSHIMAATIDTKGPELRTSAAQPLFQAPETPGTVERAQFIPNVDGTKFLVNARVDTHEPVGISVIVNWRAALKK
jgi:Tol biopolymer transport system component